MPFPAFFISILSDKENNKSLRANSQLSADGIENFLLTSLVSMLLRVSKWPWAVIFNLKISISWLKTLTKFTCKIWAKSVGLSVRSFSIWLLFYGLSLLVRLNQHLNKEILSNRSVQEKSFATYITGNLWLTFSNSITKRAKLRKLSKLFQMLFA